MHLQRFGATRDSMIDGMGLFLDDRDRQLLKDNFSCIDKDPVTAGAVMALVHLRDKYTWGILPETCLPEIMGTQAALVACAVSGDYSQMNRYRSDLAPQAGPMENTAFLGLAYGAMGMGFRDKWAAKQLWEGEKGVEKN